MSVNRSIGSWSTCRRAVIPRRSHSGAAAHSLEGRRSWKSWRERIGWIPGLCVRRSLSRSTAYGSQLGLRRSGTAPDPFEGNILGWPMVLEGFSMLS